jgi:chemotaxis protein histidine kinase CheA
MSKIKSIHIENIKRLRTVDVTPGTHLFVVGGKNDQGKSSLLDAIQMAFGGAKAAPPQPIRSGSDDGEIVIELDDGYRIRQRHTATGVTTTLHRTADGVRSEIKSPQAMLSAMAGTLALDPLAFSRESPAKQRELLASLVKLDTSAIDAEHDEAFARRTDVNRAGKELSAQIEAMPVDPDAPNEPLDTAALAAELQAEQAKNDAKWRAEEQAKAFWRAEAAAKTKRDQTSVAVIRAREALAAAEQAEARETNALHEAEQAAQAADAKAEQMPVGDTAAVTARLSGVTEHNARHAAARTRAERVAKRDALREESAALAARIEAAKAAKAQAIADAKFPVDGLGFSPSGITYGGIPFEQASSSVRIRVAMAIVAAMAPKLRCALIRDGMLLDDDALTAMTQWAIDNDMQILMERVGTGAECSIVMHDGSVLK